MSGTPPESLARRDALIDALIGLFFLLLGLGVLAGILYAELTIDRLVNAGAGLLLLGTSAVFAWRARVQRRR